MLQDTDILHILHIHIHSVTVQKKLKELELKIVYVDDYGQINKSLTKKYHTDYVCPGYKEYAKQGVKVD